MHLLTYLYSLLSHPMQSRALNLVCILTRLETSVCKARGKFTDIFLQLWWQS
uniref:Uncharacterized protein n=1 Tax=Arundo donax TaxID=35708 RepID=A0A0A8YNA8_ARUDO